MYQNLPRHDEDDDTVYDNDVYTQIEFEEDDHLDKLKEPNTYYIGICCMINKREILYMNSVSAKTFFKYSIDYVIDYLKLYSIMYSRNPRLQIMQLYIGKNETYNVLLKTHWIRLVQRHWKSRYQAWLRQIRTIEFIKNRAIRGKSFPRPSFKGMLSQYAKYRVQQ